MKSSDLIRGFFFSCLFCSNFVILSSRDQILSILRNHKVELLKRYPIARLELFGSYVRGDQDKNSDVDLRVEFNGPIGWEIVDLMEELKKLLEGKKSGCGF